MVGNYILKLNGPDLIDIILEINLEIETMRHIEFTQRTGPHLDNKKGTRKVYVVLDKCIALRY